MKYEAFLGKRVEFVEAETPVQALVEAQSKCEKKESLICLKEQETGKPIWAYQHFIKAL